MTESPIPSVSNSQTQTQTSAETQPQAHAQDDKNEKPEKAVLMNHGHWDPCGLSESDAAVQRRSIIPTRTLQEREPDPYRAHGHDRVLRSGDSWCQVCFGCSASDSRTGPSNIGNVISQILLCKQITPNFHEEELCSIKKDSEEIRELINELQEFMPQSDGDIEKYTALQNLGSKGSRGNGRRTTRWNQSNRPPSRSARQSSYFRGALNLFCCAARANYV
ncbi:decima isoform X2 [Lasioglossum baleicum]|uniref:decima isoform X2 n=1 Tax=Lasioglossum baleicum TaxID=434251 RepID=UPI003FCCD6EF